jgi:redox-sensitive bicupin YhaK (pirin superfamily)
MIQVESFETLGHFRNDWLNARHHFSFGEYHDAKRMGVGALRVWNDDEIAAGRGFGAHPHREMEIITYVREGAITHEDSLGNKGRTEAGDVQVMHAGTGITHAERNLEKGATRIFQIWLTPNRAGVAPGWGARSFPKDSAETLKVLADGRAGADGEALALYADGAVLAGSVRAGQTVRHLLAAGRAAYLVPATGSIVVNGVKASTRDGVTVTDESEIVITAESDAEIVLVDVAL